MPISREDFEAIWNDIKAQFDEDIEKCHGVAIEPAWLKKLLESYVSDKQLTVERVIGMIKNRINICMHESKFKIQAELIDLLKEIEGAEKDIRSTMAKKLPDYAGALQKASILKFCIEFEKCINKETKGILTHISVEKVIDKIRELSIGELSK